MVCYERPARNLDAWCVHTTVSLWPPRVSLTGCHFSKPLNICGRPTRPLGSTSVIIRTMHREALHDANTAEVESQAFGRTSTNFMTLRVRWSLRFNRPKPGIEQIR